MANEIKELKEELAEALSQRSLDAKVRLFFCFPKFKVYLLCCYYCCLLTK